MDARALLAGLAASALLGSPLLAATPAAADPVGQDATTARFATYNASLNRTAAGALVADLSDPGDKQAAAVAEVIQITRPDVVLLNEFDYVPGNAAVDLFRDNFLAVPHHDAQPIDYPYAFSAPVNTGVDSGFDLNRNGKRGEPDDAWGFGAYPGQYGMVVLSRYPIDTAAVRTFQNFPWADMPGALLPDNPATNAPADWYSPQILRHFPLSSKSHWDVPITIGTQQVHALVSHPTPPSFDGPEQRNKLRNNDEIRFWADYITPGKNSYIRDDNGTSGGLNPSNRFVIMGDENSDPHDGDSQPGAIQQLLHSKRLVDPLPASEGGPEAAVRQGGANATHASDPAYDTADFTDTPRPGNLRTDYVLPSRKGLLFTRAGVFWPVQGDPLSRLTGEFPFPTSDHRLVWVDLCLQ